VDTRSITAVARIDDIFTQLVRLLSVSLRDATYRSPLRNSTEVDSNGCRIRRAAGVALRADGRPRPPLCVVDGPSTMSWILVLLFVLSVALFTYLIVAMFYPEKFL
jgi:K+-transporting ATPase KdpF subunit